MAENLNLETISTYPTKILEKYQRAITKELEKRSGSELKAIKKQLAKLAEMTGMKIVEEEEVVSASEEISTEPIEAPSPSVGEGEKEENEVAVSAPEETPPAGGPVGAGKASGEEEVVPLKKKKGRPVPRRKSWAR
jgi:hypothetical protein